MLFESGMSLLYSDTMVPDIFITDYLPSLESDFVKVYLYCLFLGKHNKQAAPEDVSRKLELDPARVKEAFARLEGIGVITRKENSIVFVDLKEKEIRKLYRLKMTSTPEEAAINGERNKGRIRAICAINNTFFQGLMSPCWYTDIDDWFDKYKFDEDVMYALFQHCCNHTRSLTRQYVANVAESWHLRNIRNNFDLDRYSVEYQKLKEVKSRILKKLKPGRNLMEDEEDLIEKWVLEYKCDMDTINLAFKEAVGKKNPFKTVDIILCDWSSKGLKTLEDIKAHIAARLENRQPAAVNGNGQGRSKQASIPQHTNFEQRQYDKEYFDKIYSAYEE